MKTVEEKAMEYTDNEFAILPKSMAKENMRHRAQKDFEAGYNEAMRWRDPNREPPDVGMKVLVKTSNGKYSVTEMYIYKESSGTALGSEWRGSYDFRMSVIGWRPIE